MAANGEAPVNPADNNVKLEPNGTDEPTKNAHQQTQIYAEDSATTKAEKVERQGISFSNGDDGGRSPKRIKVETNAVANGAEPPTVSEPRRKGVTPIKPEYIIDHTAGRQQDHDDDAAESKGKVDDRDRSDKRGKKDKKDRGQNKARKFGSSRDELRLCSSRVMFDEFKAPECKFGGSCRYEHDLRKYLKEGKREDLDTFGGVCPVFEARGVCNAGWKCRMVKSHSKEVTHEDGRVELTLIAKDGIVQNGASADDDDDDKAPGVLNVVPVPVKIALRKKQYSLPRSDEYNKWLEERQKKIDKEYSKVIGDQSQADVSAGYVEAPFRPSEKRRIYYGPETPILAPLTTQGNLPFRRLCVSLGAQVTWSEMAMGMPLIQGEKQEWALMKAHESEMAPPRYTPKSVLPGYNNDSDIRFGAQISANKPWLATKTVEALTELCPRLRAIDLNCGCPIDLVHRTGAGCALMDNPGRLEKMLRGMNAVSKEVPITVKIRMGTKDSSPTADKLIERIVLGGGEAQRLGEGAAGVAAIAIHGRSRQQRYTRQADWGYIAECAALVEGLRKKRDAVVDTVREVDGRDEAGTGAPYFIGNGDVYSHVDYDEHLRDAKVDAVMIGRGALIKPWIFEEVEKGQYLDKSSAERLRYIEQFARNGLEYWGSDEIGVGTTRRFLLEWLSFSCRYVPLGILEHLPPRLGDRPPSFRGRDELETLLSSPNYKDWIKISEMFLGPAHKDFQFQPKHKSNSYEIEAEG